MNQMKAKKCLCLHFYILLKYTIIKHVVQLHSHHQVTVKKTTRKSNQINLIIYIFIYSLPTFYTTPSSIHRRN